ncbi:KdsC family phosphatase [Hymenobacter jeollabukensis]|uniref:3-deoxy-D-manno-octulosonate 8-phosphate phosphatase n=1 Tax=Hymenobacter jeollabukensis TaxID=2025313 RepID=A0A5R8WIK1_9BACT|nr:3-deoxy-D-manno-octulosonate 8-phosphate phosphatase [Hymenobacter jeollabukensis]TLM88553.1 3-deoxy-D-manno-octulosonate 8-phosphate phosphatase [Hymenobacter jeollabukensis]
MSTISNPDFSAIEAFVFDVDGVLTDGTLLALSTGEQARTFHIRDGYAIRHALRRGYRVVIISGRQEEGVRRRLESLDVTEIYLGVDDKVQVFGACGLDAARVAYMGDDMPDLDVMQRCHLAACPADAAADVRAISQYVAQLPGGRGAVRELIEAVMKAQGRW